MSSVIIKKSKLKSTEIPIDGYKHSMVSLVALAVGYNANYEFKNIPNIEDTRIFIKILTYMGKNIKYEDNNMKIYKSNINTYVIPNEYSKKIHGAVYLIPAILGVKHKVTICNSGGCKIGDEKTSSTRPIEHMITVMEKFGAKFEFDENGERIGTINNYQSADINIMDFSIKENELTGPCISGATKTALICSLNVTKGTTYIRNPYMKPDVTELLEVMRKIGFLIEFENSCLIIKPPIKKEVNIIRHSLISDITEIITYISLAIYCEIELKLLNITVDRVKRALKPELMYLKKMDINLEWLFDEIKIPVKKEVISTDIDVYSTSIYSDSQPFFALMLLKGNNKSKIREFVWKNRFNYALEMNKLGVNLNVKENELIINPGIPYKGGGIIARDLRAAAVLIIFALNTKENIEVFGIEHLKRGYVDFFEKLKKLKANFKLNN